MNITNKSLTMQLGAYASMESLKYNKRELLAPNASKRPLFTVRLLDNDGTATDYNAFDSKSHSVTQDNSTVCCKFSSLGGLSLNVVVYIKTNLITGLFEFSADIDNGTDCIVEYFDFPEITVKNDLIGAKGESRIFWPAMEGCLIEDASLRENMEGYRYKPVAYPSKGWEGFYPGPVPMQFMAYYDNNGGLYFASHDPNALPKAIEWHETADGIRLEYRLFLSVDKHSRYQMDFPMVIGELNGDWMKAAEIYRKWVTEETKFLPPKLAVNSSMPDWLEDSPLIVVYPVRGEKDTGQMNPNEFFPYCKALPVLDEIAEKTGCRILSLLMHWEGTAPWAPPFIWPPYGGEKVFSDFVKAMHKRGNLVGLYASGLGWTDESNLWPEYNMKKYTEEHGLDSIMCAAPDQSVPNSMICNGPIRWGHDMCPNCKQTKDIVVNEIQKVLDADVDYLQYFDQSLGGSPCLCYSQSHGHIAVPGRWQIDAMEDLYSQIDKIRESKKSKPLIGCESGAAECYISHLGFSDLRYAITSPYAKPVPAYSFVFHEYVVNFMGNQNAFNPFINNTDNPDSLLFRMAYSFIAGDILTAVIKGNGDIFWDWGTVWDTPSPNQENLFKLIRNLSSMRRGTGKPYLHYGKMIKTTQSDGIPDFLLKRVNGSVMSYPHVLCSEWQAAGGGHAQIFVNYATEDITFNIHAQLDSLSDADGASVDFKTTANGTTQITVPALSSLCAKISHRQ